MGRPDAHTAAGARCLAGTGRGAGLSVKNWATDFGAVQTSTGRITRCRCHPTRTEPAVQCPENASANKAG